MMHLNPRRAAALGVGLLLASYVVYSRDAAYVGTLIREQLPLRKPLSQLPLTLGEWLGEDIPLEEGVAAVAGAHDYVNRRYRSPQAGDALVLYLAYYGSHRAMVGHHPDRCYAGFGWEREMERVETVQWSGLAGNGLCPVTLHRFRRGADRATVLSFYDAGGTFTANHEAASRAVHNPITGKKRNYLLRVMISVPGSPPVERALRMASSFLGALFPAMNPHLPDSTAGGTAAHQE